jgi:hypothetical protein
MEETNKFLSEKLFVILYYTTLFIEPKHQKKTLEFVINIKTEN